MPVPVALWNAPSINIDMNIYNNITISKENRIRNGNIAKEYINNTYRNHTKIYVDASVKKHLAGGGLWENDATKFSFRYNNYVSIKNAELATILLGLVHVENQQNSVIITDSLSSCNRIKNPNPRDERIDMVQKAVGIINEIKRKNKNIDILWIPSHCGVEGNDKADKLAKIGRTANNRIKLNLSISEWKNVVRTKFTKPKLEEYWKDTETRKGVETISIIKNFHDNVNYKRGEKHLYKMIFGIANFHVYRNRSCLKCRAFLSIRHTLLVCSNFENIRNQLKRALRVTNKTFNFETILDNRLLNREQKRLRDELLEEIDNIFNI